MDYLVDRPLFVRGKEKEKKPKPFSPASHTKLDAAVCMPRLPFLPFQLPKHPSANLCRGSPAC